MTEVVILLGSNINPAENIRRGAIELCKQIPVLRSSSVWLTPAIGASGPDFYNAAVLCETDQTADYLKFNLLRPIEEKLGRVRTSNKFAPRTLDLDVIMSGSSVLEPRLWETAFMLLPVSELIPDFSHPTSGESLSVLAKKMAPGSGAIRIENFPLFLENEPD